MMTLRQFNVVAAQERAARTTVGNAAKAFASAAVGAAAELVIWKKMLHGGGLQFDAGVGAGGLSALGMAYYLVQAFRSNKAYNGIRDAREGKRQQGNVIAFIPRELTRPVRK